MDFGKAQDFLNSFISLERTMDLTSLPAPMSLKGINKLLLTKGFAVGFEDVRFFHVVGEKGKGSVCQMLTWYLYAAGNAVGLYTSPHMHSILERFWANGAEMSESEFGAYVGALKEKYLVDIDKSKVPELTFFDLLTAMALQFFVDKKVKFGVMEVGLGGRLDSTNVINAEVVVLTRVEIEHRDILGDSLAKILDEELGVLKGEEILVIGEQSEEVYSLLTEKLEGRPNVYYVRDERMILCEDLRYDNLVQRGNAKLAALALKMMLMEDFNEELFCKVLAGFHYFGRFEVMNYRGTNLVLDMAHTVESFRNLFASLNARFSEGQHYVFVISIMKDKQFEEMLDLLRVFLKKEDRIIFTKSHPERSLAPEFLVGLFGRGEVNANLDDAFDLASADLKKDQVLVVTGSHFLVSEVRSKL